MRRINIKLISLIIAICCLLTSLPVYAITVPLVLEPEISFSGVSGEAGDEISIDLTITDNPGIAYLKLKVDYDTDLSVVKAENKGVLAGTFTTSKTTSVKPYVLQWMGADDSSENGVIATVTFKISDTASAGEKAITVTVEECDNSDFDEVEIGVINGNITVTGSGNPGTNPGDEPGDEPGVEPAKPQINVSSRSVNIGENVTLDVDLSDNPGIAYLKLKVDYDNTALSLVSASNLGVLTGTFTTSKTTTVKPYVLQWMSADNSNESGTIATIIFTALKEGDTTVSVTVDECYNSEFDDVTVLTSNATVTIISNACPHESTEIRNSKPATCCENGYTGDTYCLDCDAKIATGTVIPATGNHIDADGKWETDGTQHWHTCYFGTRFDISVHTGGTATCTEKAQCSVCGVEYGDYARHKLTYHASVVADYENDGNIEYWTCDECGKYFSDSEGKTEITADDVIIPKLVINEYKFIDNEVVIEASSDAIPEGAVFDVQKIVPPPEEVVEKVKDQLGASSTVVAYYEVRLYDADGTLIVHLNNEITIKTKMPEQYVGNKRVKILQEDETGKLITMESWWEGEYICYKTDWLEIYN